MKKQIAPLHTDLLGLVAACVITVLIVVFIFGWKFSSETVDIHLYDTYFIISAWMFIIPVFLVVTFFVFISKELLKRHARAVPAVIILFTGLLLIVVLAVVNNKFIDWTSGFTGGWTAYPPLSSLTDEQVGNLQDKYVVRVVTNLLTGLQLLVTFVLLIFCYRLGKLTGISNS